MRNNDIKQVKFTLNLRYKEDRELYELLKKKSNMASFIKQALALYQDLVIVPKSDLKKMEDRIISAIEDNISSKETKN
ncbi:MAG: hypothetical protein K6G62_02705 [Eubacterium sp.]|nr:hypothetical protein [Eubacterium sp.]